MNERQNKLLKEIVESYIKDAKPVGSKALVEKLKVSSATIRNEMSELENLGYLEKTHTSSGRVPSKEGYKYYVDNIMKPKELNGEEMLKLQTIFSNHELALSDAIKECMEIISDITNYTSIVLGKESDYNTLKQLNIIPIDDKKVVALVVVSNGHVENKQVIIPDGVSSEEVVKTSEIINKYLVGTPISEVSSKLEFEIKPRIASIIKQYESIYSMFQNVFSEFTERNSNVFYGGRVNMLKQPEFSEIDKVKNIMEKLEDYDVVKKIESNEDGVNIYIGDESEFDKDVTVVKTSYHANGEEGTLAVIGPTRMEYDKVVTLLNFLKDQIER
jgi:heat-inducible transcriptional repressor